VVPYNSLFAILQALHIESDSEIHFSTPVARTLAPGPVTQNGAAWGLARISHRSKLDFSSFTRYLYTGDAGKDVNVYVLDTDININHQDFEGRATWGMTTTNDKDDGLDGLGTYSAALVAGAKYGVAKKATVTAVKVLNSGDVGQLSDIVKGLNWAADDHIKKPKVASSGGSTASFKGSVAIFTAGILGGGPESAFAMALNATISAGIYFANAAGNDNRDACNTVNGSNENAVVLGASTLADERAYFSSYGECVDLFAPGVNILSASSGSSSARATL